MNARVIKQEATVCVGRAAIEVGNLVFVRDGRREYSSFSYDRHWLISATRFEVSPDLPLREGHFTRRAPSNEESPFRMLSRTPSRMPGGSGLSSARTPSAANMIRRSTR